MRPVTPTPNGCSMTLFACQINVNLSQEQRKFQPTKPKRNLNINNLHPQNKKKSLRGYGEAKSKIRQSFQGQRNLQNSCQTSKFNKDHQSEVSSVLQLKHRQQQNQKKQKICKNLLQYKKNLLSVFFNKTKKSSKKNFLQIQQINSNSQGYEDQITLNIQNSYKQIKERQTAHTNKFSPRRVFIQENKVSYPNLHTNREIVRQVFQSELVGPSNYNLRTSISPNITNSYTPIYNNSEIFQSVLKNKSFIETNNFQISNYGRNKEPIKTQIQTTRHQNTNIQNSLCVVNKEQQNSSKNTPSIHFENRINTLVDLNCKNVDSSLGQKTSSNHISIQASQESVHNSNFDSNIGQFTKVIKLMTLKKLPLNQQIWNLRNKNKS